MYRTDSETEKEHDEYMSLRAVTGNCKVHTIRVYMGRKACKIATVTAA